MNKKKQGGVKTQSNKGGTLLQQPLQQQQKQISQKKKQSNEQKDQQKQFNHAFEGKGIKLGQSKEEPMNWICKQCGFINQALNEACKFCQLKYEDNNKQFE